jgi:hypothetical protein
LLAAFFSLLFPLWQVVRRAGRRRSLSLRTAAGISITIAAAVGTIGTQFNATNFSVSTQLK